MDRSASRVEHWEEVYRTRRADQVSWYQASPVTSLALVEALGVGAATPVIDVGAGASTFVDALVARGFTDLSVLDVSATALDAARSRVGAVAPVEWITADVLAWTPARAFGLWHDRAVLHFLVDEADRDAYLATLQTAVPEGAVILATFAPDGPEACSGLPVRRYDGGELAELLEGFEVVDVRRELHRTPWGAEQPFTFVAARRRPAQR